MKPFGRGCELSSSDRGWQGDWQGWQGHGEAAHTCMQLVNMTHTDISLEKILSSSGLVSMQSFRQLSRKLVWWLRTSSMLHACDRTVTNQTRAAVLLCPKAPSLPLSEGETPRVPPRNILRWRLHLHYCL